MKETSFKAGVIGGLCGIFTFLVLFATTSKASVNEPAGLSVCICTTFEDADWLSCWGSHMSYDVHGVYPDDVDDLSKEAYLEMYLKETNPIICESDDEFINMCKQIKGK